MVIAFECCALMTKRRVPCPSESSRLLCIGHNNTVVCFGDSNKVLCSIAGRKMLRCGHSSKYLGDHMGVS